MPYTVEILSTFCNNLIGCKTGFNVTVGGKTRTISFQAAKRVARFSHFFVSRFSVPLVFFVVFLLTGDEENWSRANFASK